MFEAFLAVFIVGFFTVIGGFLSLYTRIINQKMLSSILGVAGGAMLYVAFVKLFDQSGDILSQTFLISESHIIKTLSFIMGILFVAIVDDIMPYHITDGIVEQLEPDHTSKFQNRHNLFKMGMVTLMITMLNNIPQGIAIFAFYLLNPMLGICLAIAIGIHNIPKGVSIAMPIYYSTKNKHLAMLYTLISGSMEPLGGFLTFYFLDFMMNELTLGILFAFVAGMMIYITVGKILPASRENRHDSFSMVGVAAGIAIIAIGCNIIDIFH